MPFDVSFTPFDNISPASQRSYPCLRVNFDPADAALKARLKALGMLWAPGGKYYYILVQEGLNANSQIERLRSELLATTSPTEGAAEKPSPQTKPPQPLSPAQTQVLARFEQMLHRKRNSARTIQSYKSAFLPFLRHRTPRLPAELSPQEVQNYMAGLMQARPLSESHQNIIINAIQLHYEAVEGRPRSLYVLPRPKRPHNCPRCWTRRKSKI